MSKDSIYTLNIDTGGTFTDCIASTPDGKILRRKVLSTSSLRGNITRFISPDKIEISSNWGLTSDLIKGYSFSLLEHDHDPVIIKEFSPLTGRMVFDTPLIADIKGESTVFEISAGEEAPVLCARLITETLWVRLSLRWRYVWVQRKAPMLYLSTKEPERPCWLRMVSKISWLLVPSNDRTFLRAM